ncbi:MAG: HAMP domain-containing histidine kinase [Bdellovibrionales bacterium]|nr:HAMP domain-containing histidine kinase [Bdellovibrionales bacterium]
MIRKHRWVWFTLFILAVIILGLLATGWNLEVVKHYSQIEAFQKSFPSSPVKMPDGPTLKVVLGSLGFVGILIGLIVIYIRLIQEMRLNQMQSEFLAAVSHELKTPIATLELTSSLLRKGGLTGEEMNRLWTSHRDGLLRLKTEVSSLLEAAQWQANLIRPRLEEVQLESYLVDSFPRWQQMLGESAQLIREGDRLDQVAILDPRILDKIFDNLIDNARKFSGNEPRVIIRTKVSNPTEWRVEVQDEGRGFDASERSKLFKKFQRLKVGHTSHIAGSGLGLYLVAAAATAMKLKVDAHSDGSGKGALFAVSGHSS